MFLWFTRALSDDISLPRQIDFYCFIAFVSRASFQAARIIWNVKSSLLQRRYSQSDSQLTTRLDRHVDRRI